MKLGILGLPGAGKSTLFDLLTERFEERDFSVPPNRPRIRTVKVFDPRLDRLEEDYHPKKKTRASFELYDFSPLAGKEGSRGGIADLLAPARELDALYIVLRNFVGPEGLPPDVQGDLEEVLGECILADLVITERRLERLEEKSRKPTYGESDRRERALLGSVREHLEADRPLSAMEFDPEQRKRLSGFGFLSAKPSVVAVNRGEGAVEVPVSELEERADSAVIELRARDEADILQLAPEERDAFLEEYDIRAFSRERLIAAGYRAAGRISFFTAGEKEVRSWTIRDGMTAVEAAGEIHTDFARGFIRADVVGFDDYVGAGGIKGARERGDLRLEGKEYVVRDGDIIEFRFSV